MNELDGDLGKKNTHEKVLWSFSIRAVWGPGPKRERARGRVLAMRSKKRRRGKVGGLWNVPSVQDC